MEQFYKALQSEGLLVRLIRVENGVGEYDAFDLISDELHHLHTDVLEPRPNKGWTNISSDEYANLLLDTLEERESYMEGDSVKELVLPKKEILWKIWA